MAVIDERGNGWAMTKKGYVKLGDRHGNLTAEGETFLKNRFFEISEFYFATVLGDGSLDTLTELYETSSTSEDYNAKGLLEKVDSTAREISGKFDGEVRSEFLDYTQRRRNDLVERLM